jgi:hypothetical protein
MIPMADVISSGAPMRPRAGMARGTSRERYSTVANNRALNPGIRPGPMMNVQSRTPTRPWPTATSAPASVPAAGPACRIETTASRLTMPTTMVAASNIRVVTKPSARPSWWRLITE